jgi:hypothetical protein
VRDSLATRALLRRLTAEAQARSAGLILDAGSDDPAVGETLHAGEKLTLVVKSSLDVTVVLVHVMGDGSTHIWVPAARDGVCPGGPAVKAATRTVLCSWPGSAPPYGLDLLYVIAAEGSSPALAGLSHRELTPAVAKVLEEVVRKHPGRVAMVELPLFTVGRMGI